MVAGVDKVLALLIKEVGQPIAGKLWAVISGEEKQKQLLRAIDLINQGASALDACQRSFGKPFGDMITDVLKADDLVFSAGIDGYITVKPEADDAVSRLKAMRTELSVNLDRLAKRSLNEKSVDLSPFKGFFTVWEERARDLGVLSHKDDKVVESLYSLLDGSRRNGWQVYQILIRSGFGIIGTLLIIKAVLILTSAGLGAFGALLVWLYGLPTTQIIALAGTGLFMLILSQIRFTDTRVLNTCVSALEKLLRRKIRQIREATPEKTDLGTSQG
jgi:hypothetical protein